MINLAIRNWKLYLRDRATVLYSMLSVFIIIGLYVLFLGDNMNRSVANIPSGRFLVDSWIMAGLVGVTSFTTTLGALGTIVDDRDRKISKDFQASPLGRWQISGGYLLSAVMIGFFMCCVTLLLAEVYIVVKGGSMLPIGNILRVLGIALLSSVVSATLLFPVVMTVRSNTAFGGVSTIVGTLIGFLTGMYIPIGEVPPVVQTVMKCFPTTHAVSLLRQTMMEQPAALAFANAPPAIQNEVYEQLGVVLYFGGTAVDPWLSLLILAGTAVVFFGLSALIVSRAKQK